MFKFPIWITLKIIDVAYLGEEDCVHIWAVLECLKNFCPFRVTESCIDQKFNKNESTKTK